MQPIGEHVVKLFLGQILGMGIPMQQALHEAKVMAEKLGSLYAGKSLDSLLDPPVRYAAQLDINRMEDDVKALIKGPGA
jgi:hypothetical protein